MKKMIAAAIAILLISGCGMQTTRESFMNRLSSGNFGRIVIEDSPYYHYCFGKSKSDAETELQVLWLREIHDRSLDWPKIIPYGDQGLMGGGLGESVEHKYITENAERFRVDGLNYMQKKACEDLYAMREGWFVAALQ